MVEKTIADIYNCKAYACYLRDEDELQKSTSGGAFYVLAKKVLMQNGVVFGAAFSNSHMVEHIEASTLEELEAIRKSKYVQSRIGNAYIRVKKYLENSRMVLFSGTPCQIAGLKCFLGKEYSNLLTVDLICHGVPSEKLLQEHIERLEDTNGKILRIQFRDKQNGWNNVSVSYETMEHKQCVKAYEDAYFYGFDKYYFLRPSCYECDFRGLKSGADITIGDYWGIQKEHSEFWNDNGVSAVILKSEKGVDFFEDCKKELVWCESSVEKIANYNIFVTTTIGQKKSRTLFFNEYLSDKRDLFKVYGDMKSKMNRISIGVIGSYSSRKAIHSVKSYNEEVEIEWQITASSICSMMSDEVSQEELSFLKLDNNNVYRMQAVQSDLNKDIKKYIDDRQCDYLLVDFLEERHPLMCVEENKLLTVSDMFEEFCDRNELESIRKWDMLDVPFDFWTQKCDMIISLIKSKYLAERIILNRIYLTENIGIYKKERCFPYIERIKAINERLGLMYDYFEEHFEGIQSISIYNDKTDYCFEKFEFGCEPFYYNRERYIEIRNEIIKILENNREEDN